MPHFLFAYHGGKQPETSEETEVEIERWRSWFDRIGPAIVDPGNPVGAAMAGRKRGRSRRNPERNACVARTPPPSLLRLVPARSATITADAS